MSGSHKVNITIADAYNARTSFTLKVSVDESVNNTVVTEPISIENDSFWSDLVEAWEDFFDQSSEQEE